MHMRHFLNGKIGMLPKCQKNDEKWRADPTNHFGVSVIGYTLTSAKKRELKPGFLTIIALRIAKNRKGDSPLFCVIWRTVRRLMSSGGE